MQGAIKCTIPTIPHPRFPPPTQRETTPSPPIPISSAYSSTSLLTRMLSTEQHPTAPHYAPATPTLTVHSEDGTAEAPNPPTKRWGLPICLWRSTSRRAWLGTTTTATTSSVDEQPHPDAIPSPSSVLSQGHHIAGTVVATHPPILSFRTPLPYSTTASSIVDDVPTQPTPMGEATAPQHPWWLLWPCSVGDMVPASPGVDANMMADDYGHSMPCHPSVANVTTPTRGSFHTDMAAASWQQVPGTALWLELKDGMGWWLMACVCAQMALMWYISSGLLSRNTAGAYFLCDLWVVMGNLFTWATVTLSYSMGNPQYTIDTLTTGIVLILLLSSGNILGFLGALLFLWCVIGTNMVVTGTKNCPPNTTTLPQTHNIGTHPLQQRGTPNRHQAQAWCWWLWRCGSWQRCRAWGRCWHGVWGWGSSW